MEQSRKRILIVEDEEALAKLLRYELAERGYDVRTERYGGAALTSAADRQPHLVILDLTLPDMTGYDVCKELRTLYHSWVVPVLILTAMNRPIDQIRGFAHGADAYLTKPFELDELVTTVSDLLGESTRV